MSAPDSASPPVPDSALVQKALAHVQAIFRGNGVKKESITVVSHQINHHTISAGTYLELKPVVNERQSTGKIVSGQPCQSRDDALRGVDQTMLSAVRDAAAKAQISNVLLERPDQGFGLAGQVLPLEFLKREYSWQEACKTCQGHGKGPCPRCMGSRRENCIKCNGRRMMFCPQCRGTGLLQGNKCTKCHGQRYVPCNGCNQTGMMVCRTCNGQGTGKCNTCGGQGWKTHILSLAPQAMTYFEYDAKSVPKPTADMVETRARDLAASGKIKLRGRIADEKENVLGANYEVEFPYGDIVFSIGNKDVKAHVFGKDGDFVDFPPVLDKVLLRAVESLQDAARDVGSVAGQIREATKFRVIAQAYLAVLKMPPKKALALLMKQYDIALSLGMAEKLVMLAEQTTARITRKPRYYGLLGGLCAVAGLNALYYLVPLRAYIAPHLPSPRFDILLDLPLPVIGGLLTTAAIRLTAARAMQRALGPLLNRSKDKSSNPLSHLRTRNSGLWGYLGAGLVTLSAMELAALLNRGSPYWYELARTQFLSLLGL